MYKLILFLHFLNPTPERVYNECIKQGVKYPEIVTKQSMLETGHYKSYNCIKRNNLFGLYNSQNGDYFTFNHWTESVTAYKTMVQYKYKDGDYYKFLIDLPYAISDNYVGTLKNIKLNLVFE
jgi:hypothetical protein